MGAFRKRMIRAALRSVFYAAAVLQLAGTAASSQQPNTASMQGIRVPYGLAWGDTTDKVRQMIGAVKAREISFSAKGQGKEVLEAEGLGVGDPLLKKSLFLFRDGSLTEVELQYGDHSWDAEKTTDFFDRTRRRINEKYGAGTLLTNKVKEQPVGEKIPDGMTYSLIVYQWSQPAVVLELDYYAVEDGEKSLRIVSLHYKAP